MRGLESSWRYEEEYDHRRVLKIALKPMNMRKVVLWKRWCCESAHLSVWRCVLHDYSEASDILVSLSVDANWLSSTYTRTNLTEFRSFLASRAEVSCCLDIYRWLTHVAATCGELVRDGTGKNRSCKDALPGGISCTCAESEEQVDNDMKRNLQRSVREAMGISRWSGDLV